VVGKKEKKKKGEIFYGNSEGEMNIMIKEGILEIVKKKNNKKIIKIY
jgi:hypothetical protein